MNRREARETALTLIFESEFQPQLTADEIWSLAGEVREIETDEYVEAVFYAAMANRDEIDEQIKACAVGRSFARISKVALAVMRLSVTEMLYMPAQSEQIPFQVSINEALELVKRYDHDVPPKFVNGVLNTIAANRGLKETKGTQA